MQTPSPLDYLDQRLDDLTETERLILGKFFTRTPAARDLGAERPGLGERAADHIAEFGGSWAFIGLFAAVIAIWMGWNSRIEEPFDAFPFILLNLLLSCLAAIQAPIILMSQNRAARKDRRQARADYEVNLKAELEIIALHQKIDELRDRAWRELVAQQERQIALLEKLAQRDRTGDA